MHLCVPAFLLSLLQNQKNSHCQPKWTVVSIFPQTHINIKTIPGGYELKRQNIYVHFFPILLSGFLLVYFLLLLNICGGLFYAKHYVILIYIVRSFSCQKEGIPYEIEFPMDVSLRLMNKFLTTRTILGLWHDGHFVTWSQQRSSLKNQFCWERSSLRPITVMRTNDQEPGTMAFEKDKRPRSSWKWKLPQSSASYAAAY